MKKSSTNDSSFTRLQTRDQQLKLDFDKGFEADIKFVCSPGDNIQRL